MGRAKSMARRPDLDNNMCKLAKKNPKSQPTSSPSLDNTTSTTPTPMSPVLILPRPRAPPQSPVNTAIATVSELPLPLSPIVATTSVIVGSIASPGIIGTSSLPSVDIRSEVLGSKVEKVDVERKDASSEVNRNIRDVFGAHQFVDKLLSDAVDDDIVKKGDKKNIRESDDGDDDEDDDSGESDEEDESEKEADIPQPQPTIEKSGSAFDNENLARDDASDAEEVEVEVVETKNINRKGKSKLICPRRKHPKRGVSQSETDDQDISGSAEILKMDPAGSEFPKEVLVGYHFPPVSYRFVSKDAY